MGESSTITRYLSRQLSVCSVHLILPRTTMIEKNLMSSRRISGPNTLASEPRFKITSEMIRLTRISLRPLTALQLRKQVSVMCDRIVEVNGEKMSGKTSLEVRDKIRGPR